MNQSNLHSIVTKLQGMETIGTLLHGYLQNILNQWNHKTTADGRS